MAKKGKYAHVIGDLPKFPGDAPERRDVVEALKQEILAPGTPLTVDAGALMDEASQYITHLIAAEKRAAAGKPWASEFARVYAELRMVRERISMWDSSVSVLLEAYESLMISQFEIEGVTSLKLAGGRPVSVLLEPYAQVVDKEAFRQWAIAQGFERQMSLPWQTTNKITKDRLLEGEGEPPGVTVYAKSKIRLGSE